MRIEGDKLIIDTSMSDMEIEEFLASIKQPQISKIVVEVDDLHASIIQALWCIQSEKKVKIKVDFLKPFFEHVTQRAND